MNRRALHWLDEERGEAPFFLFLHYYDMHSSYEPSPELRERFTSPDYEGTADGSTIQLVDVRWGRAEFSEEDVQHVSDLYDAELRQLDDRLAALFDGLEQRGLTDDLLVVVTSDHGEEFMEHGGVLHGRTMYEEVIRVPLVFVGPNVPEGRRVSELAMLADVAPTVLGRLGLASEHDFDGVDLFTEERSRPRTAFAAADWKREEPDSLRMVRHGPYKMHADRLSGERRLFDLEADPLETTDVSQEHPELLEWLEGEMRGKLRPRHAAGEADPPSEEELQELRALGYFD